MPPELTARQREVLAVIRRFIAERGYPPSRSEIAAALGLRSDNAVQQHLRLLEKKGVLSRTPGAARAFRLAADPDEAAADGAVALPLVGEVAAGQPILAEGHIERRLRVPEDLFRSRPDYLLRVRGESMIGIGIRPGDLVAVRRVPEIRDGDIAVVRIDGEVTLKRWSREGRMIVLRSENDAVAPMTFDPQRRDLVIEGLLVGLLRLDIR